MKYDTSRIIIKKVDLEKDILNRVSEYDIYAYFLGAKFIVGTTFNSPFRRDVNPSFGIFRSKSGKLLYKDLGTGESGNCVSFVRKLLELGESKAAYGRALREIYKQLILNLEKSPTKFNGFKALYNGMIEKSPIFQHEENGGYNRRQLRVKRKTWTNVDIAYWRSYHISIDTLIKFGVSPIQYAFLDNEIIWEYKSNSPMYVYKIYNGLKVYRPLANRNSKWLSSCTGFDIQGYKQLPSGGELLIITKSLKDVMVLYELGYTAIAPHAESHNIPSSVVKQLKQKFDNIMVLYDRDATGMLGARKLVKEYNFDFGFIPKQYNCKDISDFVKAHDKQQGNKLLHKLTNGRGKNITDY